MQKYTLFLAYKAFCISTFWMIFIHPKERQKRDQKTSFLSFEPSSSLRRRFFAPSMSLLQISSIPHNAIAPPRKSLGSVPQQEMHFFLLFLTTHTLLKIKQFQQLFKKKFIFRVTFSLFLHLTYIGNIRDIMRKTERSETAFSSTCVAEEKANME